MRPLYNAKQMAAIAEMEAACVECEGHMQALEANGINVDDRRASNLIAQQSCQRCREIDEQYQRQQS